MRFRRLHDWDVSPREAVRIQQALRDRVRAQDEGRGRGFRRVAAVDVSYDRRAPMLFAAVVVMGLPNFDLLDWAAVRARAAFPYVPGLLSFREIPAALAAWERLETRPDCVLCDGHGYAHPRRFGLACHFGLLVDLPTVGVAKSVLVGQFAPPGPARGEISDLVHDGGVIGAAVRTRDAVAPVFVSIGHRISLATAVATVLACARGSRIPAPIRQAHALVNRLRQAGRGWTPEPPATMAGRRETS
jgi:deoxyribonuclease V